MSTSGHAHGFDRRQLFRVGGAAAAALALTPRIGSAEAPSTQPAGMQGSGFYRFNVGEWSLAVISDGNLRLEPPFPVYGANVGKDAVHARLTETFQRTDYLIGACNALLIQGRGETVLVDTGCGKLFGPTAGKLLTHLANAGVQPGDVTAVVISHAHPDHIGGMLDDAGQLVFSNAAYFILRDEFRFWRRRNPDLSRVMLPEEAKPGLVRTAKRVLHAIQHDVVRLEDGEHVIGGIELLATPGHTPGHASVLVSSGDEQFLYLADAVHDATLTIRYPSWFVGYDTNPEQGVATRKRILDRAAADKVLLSGCHINFPSLGNVRPLADGFEWVPATWVW